MPLPTHGRTAAESGTFLVISSRSYCTTCSFKEIVDRGIGTGLGQYRACSLFNQLRYLARGVLYVPKIAAAHRTCLNTRRRYSTHQPLRAKITLQNCAW